MKHIFTIAAKPSLVAYPPSPPPPTNVTNVLKEISPSKPLTQVSQARAAQWAFETDSPWLVCRADSRSLQGNQH